MSQANIDTQVCHVDTRPKCALTVSGVAILLLDGKNQSEIATIFNVSRQAVSQFIQHNADRLKVLTEGDKLMSLKLMDKVNDIIDSIDMSDIQKAGLSQRMISAGIGIDKARLLSGQSTQRVELISRYVMDIEDQLLSGAIDVTPEPQTPQDDSDL